jgi:hypothetical protein
MHRPNALPTGQWANLPLDDDGMGCCQAKQKSSSKRSWTLRQASTPAMNPVRLFRQALTSPALLMLGSSAARNSIDEPLRSRRVH